MLTSAVQVAFPLMHGELRGNPAPINTGLQAGGFALSKSDGSAPAKL
jgi:hypothetical protein